MRQRGFVKSYNPASGFGFLESTQGDEFYVHRSALTERGFLECGMEVEFESREPGRATEVTPLSVRRASAATA